MVTPSGDHVVDTRGQLLEAGEGDVEGFNVEPLHTADQAAAHEEEDDALIEARRDEREAEEEAVAEAEVQE